MFVQLENHPNIFFSQPALSIFHHKLLATQPQPSMDLQSIQETFQWLTHFPIKLSLVFPPASHPLGTTASYAWVIRGHQHLPLAQVSTPRAESSHPSPVTLISSIHSQQLQQGSPEQKRGRPPPAPPPTGQQCSISISLLLSCFPLVDLQCPPQSCFYQLCPALVLFLKGNFLTPLILQRQNPCYLHDFVVSSSSPTPSFYLHFASRFFKLLHFPHSSQDTSDPLSFLLENILLFLAASWCLAGWVVRTYLRLSPALSLPSSAFLV